MAVLMSKLDRNMMTNHNIPELDKREIYEKPIYQRVKTAGFLPISLEQIQ
jgi:hypothetical protein